MTVSKMQKKTAFQAACLAWVTATLIGCAGPSPKDDELASEASANLPESARIIQEARELPSPAKENRLLDAVPALMQEGDLPGAEALVNSLPIEKLPDDLKADIVLGKAGIALKRSQYRRVLDTLATDGGGVLTRAGTLPPDRQYQISLLRASALEGLGDRLTAANERVFVGGLLSGPQLAANNERIWDDLSRLPPSTLETLATTTGNPDMKAWLELIQAFNSRENDPLAQAGAYVHWQTLHASHPGAKAAPASLGKVARIASARPRHVALILPETGSLAAPANAIRQGFMTAWFASRQASGSGAYAPDVSTYDENGSDDINTTYARAIGDGADFVIGPLGKDQVRKLFQNRDRLPVPTLALNYVDIAGNPPVNFLQFGLSAEDDAREAANRANTLGYENAAILWREGSDWSERVQKAFAQQWQSQGHNIVARQTYRDNAGMENAVTTLLSLDESKRRSQQIENVTGMKLASEPRPRQDLDFVFLVMSADEARQVKPLFNFRFAQDLPLIGGSYLNGIARTADSNKDLDGVQFSDLPWRLNPDEGLSARFKAVWPTADTRFISFNALGADAFQLSERLDIMRSTGSQPYPGVTGVLSIDAQGRISRKAAWARFEHGMVVTLPQGDEVH